MPQTSFFITRRPPKAKIVHAAYRDDMRKRFKKVGDAHVKSRRRAVANWSRKSKPRFRATPIITFGRIGIRIDVDNGFIWNLVDKTGARPRKIRPRPENPYQRLFFQWGGPGSYQAKTGANPARFGGPGRVVGGRLTVATSVNWPGFRPRKISEKINNDIKPEELKEIKNAGRAINRAIKKRGR